MSSSFYIATRSSPLAQKQATIVKESLGRFLPDARDGRLFICQTKGDLLLQHPLAALGGKGLFTKEVDLALLQKKADIAVHSLKDMPSELPEGIVIGAFIARDNPTDVLISYGKHSLETLPTGATVGTSSLRRGALVLKKRPDLKIVPFRGNIHSRLKKLKERQADATLLACSGLERMQFDLQSDLGEGIFATPLATDDFLPALCQGTLAVTVREDNTKLRDALKNLNDIPTELCARVERTIMRTLDGSCRTPMGGLSQLLEATEGGTQLHARAFLALPTGETFLEAEKTCSIASLALEKEENFKEAEKLGESIGREIITKKPEGFDEKLLELLPKGFIKPEKS